MLSTVRFAVPALVVCAWSIGAVAQTTGKEVGFTDQMDGARQQAAESMPWLFDSSVGKDMQKRIWSQRQRIDEGVNPPPVVPTIRGPIRVTPGGTGQAVTEINTVYGIPTSVTFIDKTGAPWPLQWEHNTNEYVKPEVVSSNPSGSDRGGDQKPDPLYAQEARNIAKVASAHGFEFDIPNPGKGGNTLNITTISPSPIGGTNIFLQGAKAPIPLIFRAAGPQGGQYDAVVTIQVMAHGPQAKSEQFVSDDVPETGGDAMFKMLEGHPPADAFPLTVIGISPDRMRAWKMGGSYYLLTDVLIMGPQYTDHTAGNGVVVYKMPITPYVSIYDSDGRRETSIQLKEQQ